MAKINNVIKNNLASKIVCTFLISLFGVLLYVGLQIYSDSMYQYYSNSFKKGQIAESDVLVNNSIDIFDEKATERQKELNIKAVAPVFTRSIDKTYSIIGKFDKFQNAAKKNDFSVLRELCSDSLARLVIDSRSSEVIDVSYEILNKILDQGIYNYVDILAVAQDGYQYDDVITDVNIHSVIDDMIIQYSNAGLSVKDASLISQIVSYFAEPNIYYDEVLTSQRRKQASDDTEPIYISFERGQVILAKDRVITEEQLNLLSLLGNSSTVTAEDIVGESAFIIISMIFAMIIFSYFLESENVHAVQYLWFMTVGLILTCIISFFTINKAVSFGVSFVETCIPICFVPVLITMISGRRDLGFASSFIVGLLMSAIPGSTYLTSIYCILNGILCCTFVRFFNKRTDMFIQWLISFAITSALSVLFVYIGAYSYHEIIIALIGNAISITGTHVLIAIVLPILERIFNLSTVFRLNELGYSNNALLAKLSDAAPGTYSHSKMVSELAENATKLIGANSVLARVGGLYHDIGKIEHPEYFVENQSGINKHEDLNPSLSVAVIKSHVKVGADMARESGLPSELIDIIANHHGNDIISYFYNEAKKQADEDDVVVSTDFSYSNSSIPHTKECAVVMLADSIEAAARTVSGPTTAKFTKLINSIVYGKIERGQLDNCDLSMKEIDVIKESFLKTLSAQYHNRIEYPDEEE